MAKNHLPFTPARDLAPCVRTMMLRHSSKTGLELKMILINQRKSQEKQKAVYKDKCKVQLSKYGAGGGSLNTTGKSW